MMQASKGSLRVTNYARPGKLFTANRNLLVAEVGTLKADSFKQIIDAVVNILLSSLTLYKFTSNL